MFPIGAQPGLDAMTRSQRIAHDLLLPALLLLLTANSFADTPNPVDLAPSELYRVNTDLGPSPAAISASGALAVVQQTGQGMTGHIGQTGAELEAYIIQSGYANSASIEQIGLDNAALISQDGFGNEARIDQYGSDNRASIAQQGTSNRALIEQTGSGHSSNVSQSGRNLTVVVRQYR
jgi:minor curlin subunit